MVDLGVKGVKLPEGGLDDFRELFWEIGCWLGSFARELGRYGRVIEEIVVKGLLAGF